MRRFFKYAVVTIGAILLIVLSIPVLFYIPYVQSKVAQIVTSVASEKLQMDISLQSIAIRFPLDLELKEAVVITANNDTIVDSKYLLVDLNLKGVPKNMLGIDELLFEDTKLHIVTPDSLLNIKAELTQLKLNMAMVSINDEGVKLAELNLIGGDVELDIVSKQDTTKTKSKFGWSFAVDRLYLQDINFNLDLMPNPIYLESAIGVGDIRGACVDIAKQSIDVDSVYIDSPQCKYLHQRAKSSKITPTNAVVTETKPWIVNVANLKLTNGNATYGLLNYVPARGLDYNYISVSKLNIEADNIYNRKSDVSVNLKGLSLTERSGVTIMHAATQFYMDSAHISANALNLATQNSTIKGNLYGDISLLKLNPYAAISANIESFISPNDIVTLVPSVSANLDILPYNPITLNVDADGILSNININTLYVNSPQFATVKVDGYLRNITTQKYPNTNLNIDGSLANISPFISGKSASDAAVIPIDISGGVMLYNDSLSTKINMQIIRGRVDLLADVDLNSESYSSKFSLHNIPLNTLLHNSIFGSASIRGAIDGLGFNPLSTTSTAKTMVIVDSLFYNNNRLDAELKFSKMDSTYKSKLTTNSAPLNMQLFFNGMLTESNSSVGVVGDVKCIDLKALNLTENQASIETDIEISASIAPNSSYQLYGSINNTLVSIFNGRRHIPYVDISFNSDSSNINTSIKSPNFNFAFNAPSSIPTFVGNITSALSQTTDITEFMYSASTLNALLPICNLDINIGNDPLFSYLMLQGGVTFNSCDVSYRKDSTNIANIDIQSDKLGFGSFDLESTMVNIKQDTTNLQCAIVLTTPQRDHIDAQRIAMSGMLVDTLATLNCLQTSQQDTVVYFGLESCVALDSLTLSFTTLNPIFGATQCSVNEGNYIEIIKRKQGKRKKQILADIKIASDTKHIYLYNPKKRNGNDLGIDIAELDMKNIMRILPMPYPVEGILSTNLVLNARNKNLTAKGRLQIDSLIYNKHNVGNLDLNMNYKLLNDATQELDFAMLLNSEEVITIDGNYDPSGTKPLLLQTRINDLDLSILSAFIDSNTAIIDGLFSADISVDGLQSNPQIEGFIRFKESTLRIPYIGTTFALASQKVTVDNNQIYFKDFGLSGTNNSPLQINGTVNLGNIAEMVEDVNRVNTDLRITANNFQLIDEKRNRHSQAYGKAYADMNVNLQGEVNNLKLLGNIELLNGTEVTYTLPQSMAATQEDVTGLVSFVSLTDTLNQAFKPVVKQDIPLGIDMGVNVSIGQAVKMSVNLTSDGKSGVDIQGGGDLIYTMNPLGDTQFTGRYSITSGELRYNLPIVATKIFDIEQGGYLDWNGDIADPYLNITAINSVKTTVVSNDISQKVDFNVLISIKNRLEDLEVTLDLEAPEDITITNEIAAMSSEQRQEQAMSLLVYNTYTGGSNTQSMFNINSSLNSFVQSELNKWARNNIKNIDLSFGIDTYTGESGLSQTDYSYKLSKSLLNERLNVSVGGAYNSDIAPNEVAQSIIGDVSLEYQLDKKDNMLVKMYRSSENDILEGTIINYGVGFAVQKQALKIKELFSITGRASKEERKEENQTRREAKQAKRANKKAAKQNSDETEQEKSDNTTNTTNTANIEGVTPQSSPTKNRSHKEQNIE